MVRYKASRYTLQAAAVIFILSVCVFSVQAQDKSGKPIIAVLDFKISGIDRAEVDVFIDYLSSGFIKSGTYRVIDRMQRETILKEIEHSVSDVSDERYQIEIGRLLSANKIIVGSIGKVGDRFLLTIKLVDVKTGETEKQESNKYTSFNELIDDSTNLTKRFVSEKGIASEEKETSSGVTEARSVKIVETQSRDSEVAPRDTYSNLPISLSRRGSSVEFAGTYAGIAGIVSDLSIDYFGLNVTYMYQFNNWFSIGGGLSFLSDGYYSVLPVSVKFTFGNKVDDFAFTVVLSDYYAGFGCYYKNWVADFVFVATVDDDETYAGFGMSFGYSFYFGR